MFTMFSAAGTPAHASLPSRTSARTAWGPLIRASALGAGLALSLAATSALAQGKAAEAGDGAPAKPQNRMSSCSADFKATGRPGSERKAFMSECLRKPKKAS